MRVLPWTTVALALLVARSDELRAADPDLAKLQGRWIVEAVEYNGARIDEMKNAVREFTGEKYTLTPQAGETYSGTVRLDSAKNPKQIDLELSDRTLAGIYEIDGGTLRMCYVLEGEDRPRELASKPGSGVVLVVHRRAR